MIFALATCNNQARLIAGLIFFPLAVPLDKRFVKIVDFITVCSFLKTEQVHAYDL